MMKLFIALILFVLSTAIFADNKPVAIIKAIPAEGYIPLGVSFSGSDSYVQGGTIVDYSWSFGDGSSGNGKEVSHLYISSKKKEKVKLVVTDNKGKKSQEQFTINFLDDSIPPTLSFDVPESFKTLTPTPTITAFYSDSTSKVELSKIRFYLDSVDVTSHVQISDNHAVLQFTTTWPLSPGSHLLKVTVSDYYGNTNSETLKITYEQAITQSHYLNGKVLNINGQPEANVQIISINGPVNSQLLGLTRADGTFSLPFTVGGDYQLRFSKVGLLDIYKYKSLITNIDDSLDPVFVTEADTKKTYVSSQSGGTATNTTGSINIVIPPGSLDTDRELYFTEAKTGKTLQVPLPGGSQFTYAQNNQPSGTTFSNPADMNIENLLGFPAGFSIPVGVTNEQLGVWEDSGYRGTVRVDGSRIDFKVSHFSDYDINLNTNPPSGKTQEPAKPKESKQSGAVKNKKCKTCPSSRVETTSNEVHLDYSLPPVMRRGVPVSVGISYSSLSAKPHSIIGSRTKGLLTVDTPILVDVQADFAGFSKSRTYEGILGVKESSFALDFELKNPDGYYYSTGAFGYNFKIGSRFDDRVYAETEYFGGPATDNSSTVTTREPVYLTEYQNGRAVHVNNIYSYLGAGWTINGLERLHQQGDGIVTFEDGTGFSTYYTPLNVAAGKAIVQKRVGLDLKHLHYSNGFFYGASCDNNEVFKVDLQGRYSTLLSNNTHKNINLSCPMSVFKSRKGGLYIADSGNRRVLYLSADKKVTVTAGDDNSFVNPTFVTEDNVLAVHVVDNDEIKTISPFNRKVLKTISNDSLSPFKFDFKKPTQIHYDDNFNLLVVDEEKGELIKFYVNGGTSRVMLKLKGLTALTYDSVLKRYFLLDNKGQVYHWAGQGTDDVRLLDISSSIVKLAENKKNKKISSITALAFSPEVGLATGNDNGLIFNVSSNVKSKTSVINYLSVPGDFTTLRKLDDGSFFRTDIDKTQYFYDSSGYITSRLFIDGSQYLYEYDSDHKISKIYIPGGGVYQFQYYGFGMLQKIIDPIGRAAELVYDDKSNLIEIKTPDLNTHLYSYDANHLLTSHTDEDQLTKIYSYQLSRLASVSMPGNRVKTVTNSLINALSATPEDGAYVRLFPDNVRNTFTSPEGRNTTFVIDDYGLEGGLINGNGDKEATTRDNYSSSTGTDSPEGRLTRQSSDSLGRLTQRIDGNGQNSFFYDPSSLKVSSIVQRGAGNLTLQYNNKNLLSAFIDGMGKYTNYTYNQDGTLEAIFDMNNQAIRYTRDSFGNIISVKDRVNQVTLMSRDDAGNLLSVSDPLGFKTLFDYDESNRVTKITDAKNGETFFSYLPSGVLETVTDAKGQSTTFVYNENKEVTKIVNPLNQEVNLSLDKDGNILSKTTKSNDVIAYEYDGNSQLVKKEFTGESVNYIYNRDSLLEEVNDSDSRIQMSYDNYSRLEKEEANHYNGYIFYDYDIRGVVTQSKLVISGNNAVTNNMYYDGNKTLIKQESYFFGKKVVFEKMLDNLNRVSSLKYPNGSSSTMNYDGNSRVVDMTTNIPGVHYMDYRYTANGNLSIVYEEINQISRPNRYEYDELNRLVREQSILSRSYNYDAVGNDSSNGGVFNELNQLLEDANFVYTYDLNGNLTKKTNKLTGGYQSFVWNSENQLLQARNYKTTNVLEHTVNYKYDGLNRRIWRSVTNHLDASKSYARKFVYDGAHIVAVLDDNNQFLSGYMYDSGIDEPVVLVTDYNKDGQLDALSLVRDRQNSIKLVVNENKEIVQEVSYSAYGETKIINRGQKNPILNNNLYYTSRELEPELGIYYYRARYYDPGTGRFLSQDPAGLMGRDFNLYRYVGNSPLMFADPFGLMKLPKSPLNLPSGWNIDPTHRDPNGTRWRYKNSDRFLDFHPGTEGEDGWKEEDHWHDSEKVKGKCKKAKKHLLPGEEVPDPVEPTKRDIMDPENVLPPFPILIFPLPVVA